MQINNSQPSFGMAYKKPNLKGFAANTIDVITSALPESKKIAEDVDIKISHGSKHIVIPEDNRTGNYSPKKEYDTPFFKIKFSKPAKSIFAKILKSLRLSKEYAPITHESQTIYQADTAKQKNILIKALNEGKAKYRTEKKIDIEEAKTRFEAAMEQKKALPDFQHTPEPPSRQGHQPIDKLDTSNPPKANVSLTQPKIKKKQSKLTSAIMNFLEIEKH